MMPLELAENYLDENTVLYLPFTGFSDNLKVAHLRRNNSFDQIPSHYKLFAPEGMLEMAISGQKRIIKEQIERIGALPSLEDLNLPSDILDIIHLALFEFTEGMALENKEFIELNRKLVKERRDAIKNIKKVLLFRFLDKNVKEVLSEELKRLEYYDKEKISEPLLASISFASLRQSALLFDFFEEGIRLSLLSPIKMTKGGRPSKLLFKALQIVIYKTLHNRAGIAAEKSKNHTAEIINDFLSRVALSNWPTLKNKDIDNAIHGS
ncbi:MAG: hypothetical protein K8I29_07810 [Alphaproteobacteria bacterium]|uniref:Uncharacterized protein n=1 Tax=Candidatus Nitrobium versatile TaxID=2884831 RepID=A0A953LWN0_9BACT|nr:hypothetical protein [Candidatus Nitrobium versatile]